MRLLSAAMKDVPSYSCRWTRSKKVKTECGISDRGASSTSKTFGSSLGPMVVGNRNVNITTKGPFPYLKKKRMQVRDDSAVGIHNIIVVGKPLLHFALLMMSCSEVVLGKRYFIAVDWKEFVTFVRMTSHVFNIMIPLFKQILDCLKRLS